MPESGNQLDEVRRLLTDPGAPLGRFVGRNGAGNPFGSEDALVRYLSPHLPSGTDTEQLLQRAVLEHGGKRHRVVDLDGATAKLWSTLRGRPVSLRRVVYEIPLAWFAEQGREVPGRIGASDF